MNSKLAHSGKFTKNTVWKTWHDAFVNYLSVIPGTSGIPLAYIVRSKEIRDYTETHDTFNGQLISQALLKGNQAKSKLTIKRYSSIHCLNYSSLWGRDHQFFPRYRNV